MIRATATGERIVHKGLSSTAFTLIELLVVITIVAVMAALLMPALREAKESANNVKCISNLRQVGLAFCLYGEQRGRYPYAWENNGGGAHWSTRLIPYLSRHTNDIWVSNAGSYRPAVYVCPSRTSQYSGWWDCSYSANRQLLGMDVVPGAQYPRAYPYTVRPHETILVADGNLGGSGDAGSMFSSLPDNKLAYNPATATAVVTLPDNVDWFQGGTWQNLRFRHKRNARCNMVFVDAHVESIDITQLQERHVRLDAPVTGW